MTRYYTRVCNFYYGKKSKILVKKKKSLPLNGFKNISFDHIEIISRKSKRLIPIEEISKLPTKIKKKVNFDLNIIKKKNILKT